MHASCLCAISSAPALLLGCELLGEGGSVCWVGAPLSVCWPCAGRSKEGLESRGRAPACLTELGRETVTQSLWKQLPPCLKWPSHPTRQSPGVQGASFGACTSVLLTPLEEPCPAQMLRERGG